MGPCRENKIQANPSSRLDTPVSTVLGAPAASQPRQAISSRAGQGAGGRRDGLRGPCSVLLRTLFPPFLQRL